MAPRERCSRRLLLGDPVMADPRNTHNAMFFGCWGNAGHYLFYPDKTHPREEEALARGFPVHHLDGSTVFLPHPEIKGHGRLTYLPAPDIHILSWWNSVYDTRGAVNSHFMYKATSGNLSIWNAWHAFCHFFPDIAKDHTKPIIAVTY